MSAVGIDDVFMAQKPFLLHFAIRTEANVSINFLRHNSGTRNLYHQQPIR